MKKKYFIAFDYFSSSNEINRFGYGNNEIDLSEESLDDAIKRYISEIDSEVDISEITIKVTAFNNID